MIFIFDLDGTISDPSEGITASLNYALENLGLPTKPPLSLTKYIGPSLLDIFSDLLATNDNELIQQGISFFRERYFEKGYKENVLYPEIESVLIKLKQNHIMYIATTKKPEIAEAVVQYFNISNYFKEVLGCGTQRKKVELIKEIKAKESRTDTAIDIIMIGDRFIDMKAGKSMGCFCAGVLWGFGSKHELLDAGADVLLNTPEELLNLSQQKNSNISITS